MSQNVKATALFSGHDLNYSGETIDGARLIAAFGGMGIDLSNSIIQNDLTITVNVAFGGIEILLPKNVNAKVKAYSAFGGVSNYHINQPQAPVTVYVKVRCAFGGVDIK